MQKLRKKILLRIWRMKQLNNYIRSQLHALTTINSKKKNLEFVGELTKNCSQKFLKSLYFARIGKQDILSSANKCARAVTKWTRACDKCLTRLISNFQYTSEYRQQCHVGNTPQQCRLGLFQDSDSAGDLEDAKSTSRRILCIFGSHTFGPPSWMCKKQTSGSHSSTESEIVSPDAGCA